jgi:periplasmic protein TonB
MEPKKITAADLRKKSFLFFQIGMILSLAVVITAFEWNFPEYIIKVAPESDVFDPAFVVPVTEYRKPEPPKVNVKPLATTTTIVAGPLTKPTGPIISKPTDDPVIKPSEFQPYVPTEIDAPEPEFINSSAEAPKGFQEYIAGNLNKMMFYEGKTLQISFVIEKDGTISNIKILNGVNKNVDERIAEIIRNSGKWKPALRRSVRVRSAVTVPVRIILKD